MDEHKLIEFLKENLNIRLYTTYDGFLTVKIKLDGILITEDAVRIDN